MNAQVICVAKNGTHGFSKQVEKSIVMSAGRGVQGDAHYGETVKHRSRVAVDPNQPNLRQVHLIHQELFDEVATKGFSVRPGDLGENITTQGIDLLGLSTGTVLKIGAGVELKVTGLRNPCAQIDTFQPGLLGAVLEKRDGGALVRKSGIMAIVLTGGLVQPGDSIDAVAPAGPHRPLERVWRISSFNRFTKLCLWLPLERAW